MFSHRLYYRLKPYLPWRLRMALRRARAQKVLLAAKDTWPINPSAARPPTGWPGWPDGKKFAFVITHDVESAAGLSGCRRLMDLDRRLGFRASFNFIPAGPYQVPDHLLTDIKRNGFEVGVHDLEHDGKLFESLRAFERKAVRINRHLRDWGAVGFRSAFMLRNLAWIHRLDIAYDCSTFDSDPFELQSKGAGTIFPFWVPTPPGPAKPDTAGSRGGYVELPYTLPQDSTLFLVLGKDSPEIWIRKLDWIAEHGGMALINVHPDYICFDGETTSKRTYPVGHYRRFLEAVRDRYAGEFWQPTAGELAAHFSAIWPRPVAASSRRICMITQSCYETDNRVTRYAEALAARGDRVDVVALRRSPGTPRTETIEGVHVHRIQSRFSKSERSVVGYLWPSLCFLFRSSWWLTRRHAKERYDLVHIHNMPDFLVFAGWYPKWTGAGLILDIHDIVPEFYRSKFGGGKNRLAVGVLQWIERLAAGFADHVIISNHLWLEKYRARTGTEGKCSVLINHADTRTFQPHLRTRNGDRIIILFPGGLQWHQGLDIALRAFARVSAELPQAEFHIYGDGNMKPALMAQASESGFNGKVRFFDPVRITEIAWLMADADLGVVPKRADSFGNEAYSTKIMEFMSVGVPVVASRTKIDQYYFNDSVLRFFESGNSDALAEAMLEVLRDRVLRERIVSGALAYSTENSWNSRKTDYLTIADGLIGAADGPEARA
jgi:glycosyltransferase involved in cell wall biosynthesis